MSKIDADVNQRTQDERSSSHRVFKDWPTVIWIEKLRGHIRRTGQPETFLDLHFGPIDRNEPFRTITPIDIDRRKRPDGDYAPCPMCQPNKFLRGHLVWFPGLRACAVIGHCCASKETRSEAERDYAARSRRDFDETYLLSNLPLVSYRLIFCESFMPAAKEARRVYRRLRRECRDLHTALRRVKQDHNAQYVQTEVLERGRTGPAGMRMAGSRFESIDHNFGSIIGSTALLSNYDPVKELEAVWRALDAYRWLNDESAVIDFIISLDQRESERHRAVVVLQNAERSFVKFQDRLRDFGLFFTNENFSRLTRWGAHPSSEMFVEATLTTFTHRPCADLKLNERMVRFILDPVMWNSDGEWPPALGK